VKGDSVTVAPLRVADLRGRSHPRRARSANRSRPPATLLAPTDGLRLQPWDKIKQSNEAAIKRMLALSQQYTTSVKEETTMTAQQLKVRHIGKNDPKRHLEDAVEKAMQDSILQSLGTMLTMLGSGK